MISVASAFLQSRLNSFNVIITCEKRLVGPPDPPMAMENSSIKGTSMQYFQRDMVTLCHIVGFHQRDAPMQHVFFD